MKHALYALRNGKINHYEKARKVIALHKNHDNAAVQSASKAAHAIIHRAANEMTGKSKTNKAKHIYSLIAQHHKNESEKITAKKNNSIAKPHETTKQTKGRKVRSTADALKSVKKTLACTTDLREKTDDMLYTSGPDVKNFSRKLKNMHRLIRLTTRAIKKSKDPKVLNLMSEIYGDAHIIARMINKKMGGRVLHHNYEDEGKYSMRRLNYEDKADNALRASLNPALRKRLSYDEHGEMEDRPYAKLQSYRKKAFAGRDSAKVKKNMSHVYRDAVKHRLTIKNLKKRIATETKKANDPDNSRRRIDAAIAKRNQLIGFMQERQERLKAAKQAL